MSVVVNEVRAGTYMDSVALMRVALALKQVPGVEEAALMMATPANIAVLASARVLAEEGAAARPDDLLVAVRASDAEIADEALDVASRELARVAAGGDAGGQPAAGEATVSLDEALRQQPASNLALISVPGAFAAAEAERALDRGLHVMLFSDNVSLEDEHRLKEKAAALDRLLMGPDCGTAMIAGEPLGFANALPPGSVGVVSASGTGLQEFSVLLAASGVGLSHGIGVGGRDLGAHIGGLSTRQAIALLAGDPGTERVVVLSKPPAPAVARQVLADLAACGKPALACFLGHRAEDGPGGPVPVVGTVIEAAEGVLGAPVDPMHTAPDQIPVRAGRIEGLFAGGTLCAEAQVVALRAGLQVESNAPLAGAFPAGAAPQAGRHRFLDLGADEYTQGQPHPMLEPAVRDGPLRRALGDPAVAVVLLDVVLGYGAHPDPAGRVAQVVASAMGAGAPGTSRGPLVVASLCGTVTDPQNLAVQREALESAGIKVFGATARACEYALGCLDASR